MSLTDLIQGAAVYCMALMEHPRTTLGTTALVVASLPAYNQYNTYIAPYRAQDLHVATRLNKMEFPYVESKGFFSSSLKRTGVIKSEEDILKIQLQEEKNSVASLLVRGQAVQQYIIVDNKPFGSPDVLVLKTRYTHSGKTQATSTSFDNMDARIRYNWNEVYGRLVRNAHSEIKPQPLRLQDRRYK